MDYLAAIKKEQFFISAILFKLDFVDSIEIENMDDLKNKIANLSLKSDLGICIFNGIFEINRQYLFIDSKLFTRYVFGKISYLYTIGMLKDVKNKKNEDLLKDSSNQDIILDKKEYKLSTFQAIYWTIIVFSLIGFAFCFGGFAALVGKQTDAGIALIITGILWFLVFFIPALFMKRTVIISEEKITEKRIFRKPFIINRKEAKWMVRGSMTASGMNNALVIVSDYVFDEKELATYLNSTDKYIIIKDNENNKRIIKKIIGGETKI